MLLDDESRELLTINTHKGLFKPTRLPYGETSAPGIFQREMGKRLSHIPYTLVRIDDTLISGENDEAHLENLAAVLKVLHDSGLCLKRSKCEFLMDKVVYLGMYINSEGMSPVNEKAEAIWKAETIWNAPTPSNVSQLQLFLGMINCYQRYLPNLSSVLEPQHFLLRKGVRQTWDTQQENAFRKVKSLLSSDCLLVHFDPTKKLTLSCDTSPYGLGAVLSHEMDDGSEKPIAFAPRSLRLLFVQRSYPEIFFKLLETTTCDILTKFKVQKNFTIKKFGQFLKALTVKLSIFKNKRTSHLEILTKIYK